VGVIKGSISYSKFYVNGELPDNYQEAFMEALSLRRFTPLVVDEDADVRVGWVAIERPLEPDVVFDHNDVFFNSYVNLAIRIDAWRFPGPVFKAAFAEAEKKHLAKKGREKLTKKEKEELKAVVGRKLRHQFSPTIKVIDLSWNLQSGVVRFWNQSGKAHETLFEIWEKTFPVKLVPASPYVAATYLGLPEPRVAALASVEQSVFHTAHH
jgi:recombination associated protein RdgC